MENFIFCAVTSLASSPFLPMIIKSLITPFKILHQFWLLLLNSFFFSFFVNWIVFSFYFSIFYEISILNGYLTFLILSFGLIIITSLNSFVDFLLECRKPCSSEIQLFTETVHFL